MHPCCCLVDRSDVGTGCSVAHDVRFAIAVAAPDRVGVDVERISARPLRAMKMFMSAAEQARAQSGALSPERAATTIWTAKEAVAKALDLPLPGAAAVTEVVALGAETSALEVEGVPATAFHACLDGHLFTLVRLPC